VSARIVALPAGQDGVCCLAIEFSDGRGRWVATDFLPHESELLEAPWDPTLFFVRKATFAKALEENGLQPVWSRP
jgi:hypothetical protein